MNARERRASADGRRAREAVAARSGGMCEARIRGACRGRGENFHHRSGAGMGGTTRPDSPELLIHVCGSGTTGCHGWIEHNRTAALAMGLLVARNIADASLVPVLYMGRGKVRLLADGGKVPIAREDAIGPFPPDWR